MSVITRFAPSPTGMLHIGGARTALFNYLYAKRHGGQFLLRIEDTDRARSTPEAVDAILDGIAWLELTPDQPPVFQSQNEARHREVAEAMVEAGSAFRCYVTPEELQERRESGEAKRKAAKDEALAPDERETLLAEANALLAPFRSPYRDGTLAPPSSDAPYTTRLKAPDAGDLVIEDDVQGRVSIKANEIDDLVLLRADGTPTYMLAVVVDDHDMGVTHIIRGDDHLRNAFRQKPIYEAMGWDVPRFSHVPLIHGPDGAKLSKRHGDLAAAAYRDLGYLPEALNNYLLRLGWAHGDAEILSREEAITLFDLSGINKAPARLDLDKLGAVNAHYIRSAELDRIAPLVMAEIQKNHEITGVKEQRIHAALPNMLDRGSTLIELANAFGFLLTDRPLALNKKARKSLRGEALDRLALVRNRLSQTDSWTSSELKLTLQALCDETGLSMGQFGPPLRSALTGGLPAPDIDQVLEWLGRDEALARMDDQISAAEPSSDASSLDEGI